MSRAADLRRVMVHACHVQGCTCDPQVTIREDDGVIVDVQVAHDDWCPLLRAHDSADGRRQQVVIADMGRRR